MLGLERFYHDEVCALAQGLFAGPRLCRQDDDGSVREGLVLPQLDQDLRRNNTRVQRFLLLAGLIWISLGFGVFVFFTAVLAHPQQEQIPQGIQWSGVAPVLIGVSHLIVYFTNRNKEI